MTYGPAPVPGPEVGDPRRLGINMNVKLSEGAALMKDIFQILVFFKVVLKRLYTKPLVFTVNDKDVKKKKTRITVKILHIYYIYIYLFYGDCASHHRKRFHWA